MNASQPAGTSPSMASPALPAFDNTLGSMEIGLVISSVLFGILICQSYAYYQRYSHDPLLLRIFVATLVIIDGIHTAFIAHAVYHYTVINYAKPTALSFNEWSLTIQVPVTTLVGCLAQCFFAGRIYIVGRNIYATIGVISTSLSAFGTEHIFFSSFWVLTPNLISEAFSIVVAQKLFATKLTSRLHELIWAMITSLALDAACDLMIVVTLCYYLNRRRSGFKSTETLINKLIMWTINTGLLTSVVAVVDLICVVSMQDNLVYAGVFFIVSKLYANSVLASLNLRGILKSKHNHVGENISLTAKFARHPDVTTSTIPVTDDSNFHSKSLHFFDLYIKAIHYEYLEQTFVPMALKKKTSDKVPAGTSDDVDSGSTPNITGGNDPTLDPGKDPSQAASATSEMNTSHPMTWSTCVTDQLAQLVSERGMSEDPTQTPNPHGGSRDSLLPKTYSDYSEPSERSALADPDPEELALGNQIQEMLHTINEHMDEVKSIHNMSRQVAQLLKYPTIGKGKLSIHPRDPTKDPNNEEIDPHSEQPIN
ncbi:hypothetical protein M422DRAFT_779791 [Sphaerobolus stellatus SS14]|uniref:DUF6534 domain-containing protein n=1 Tax=Sphaerobolus stellatus (strain SS14) TaxID=990650 RepID=A0A0C9VX75_SPHS4|nr:hypothetical protein M422DRAFT_779791 [Sphaerobolus stellatus SS14]